MNATAKISHWTLALAMAGACVGASAQSASDDSFVWVDNDRFEFVSCEGVPMSPAPEQVAATMSALRARATEDLNEMLRVSGVQLGRNRLMLLTPLEGALSCRGHEAEITFRAVAVDQRSGKRWVSDVAVGSAVTSVSYASLNRMAGDLAGVFGMTVASTK